MLRHRLVGRASSGKRFTQLLISSAGRANRASLSRSLSYGRHWRVAHLHAAGLNARCPISACRGRKVAEGADLRLGGARRGRRLDASARHPDAEARRCEHPTPGRAQGTFGGPEGRDAGYGAAVRYVSALRSSSPGLAGRLSYLPTYLSACSTCRAALSHLNTGRERRCRAPAFNSKAGLIRERLGRSA